MIDMQEKIGALITSQGHNHYKLKIYRLNQLKLPINLIKLCLKIVSTRSNLQSQKYNCFTLKVANFKGLAYTFPDDVNNVL